MLGANTCGDDRAEVLKMAEDALAVPVLGLGDAAFFSPVFPAS